MTAPLLPNESQRLETLRSYRVLDTERERDFDDVALMASQVCGTPIALITLIDADRQWFKAKIGLSTPETPREIAFCAHAIAQGDPFIVPDAMADERFATNPLVMADPHIRFYAGAPLVTWNGHAIGTICVMDRVPRELSREQIDGLQALSRQVVTQLELRRASSELTRTAEESQEGFEALRASEEFKTRLIECSRDCLEVLDLDGRLLWMNAGGMEVLQICDFAPFVKSSWIDFWQGEDRDAARAAVDVARHGRVGRFVGYVHTRIIGEPRWWDVTVNAILDVDGKPERLLAVSRDVTEWKRTEQLIRAITEGTAAVTGDDFFRSLVRHLAGALHLRYAFVAECLPMERARSLAFWQGGTLGENFEYDLRGTPCLNVAKGRACFHPDGLQQLFPKDPGLVALQAESYHGVPVLDSTRMVIGHLVVMDDHPMHENPLRLSVLETFAARAGAELERVRAYEHVQSLNLELGALLDINRSIGRHLDRDELFGSLATCLKTLVPTERFGIELPMEGGNLQGHILTPHRVGAEATQPTVLPAQGTACHWVLQERTWFIAASREELRERFPVTFDVMSCEQMESLCALPLVSGGHAKGALFFMAAAKGIYSGLRRGLLEQVANAVAVALDNCLAHEELRRQGIQALAESEERFRDLFDEAPIAYVHEGLDSRFIRANRAAMRSLGIKPEEVPGTYGASFVPDTPDAQRRLREAFASIGCGTDTSGVVLELRRKDNGKPLWIQWWSKPDSTGKFTRTMFVDITDRVLMEQEKARLEAENTYLQEEIQNEHNFEEMIGASTTIKKVFQAIEKVAETDATVLVTGETGTGKELIARAIHHLSKRKDGVLVKVNCAALPAGLIESELFGHEKGAFTGALARKIGRFELADGATIFLDEIGDLPLDLQAKLLRVLQEGEFERLGSPKTLKVNVRVITATNRDLERLTQEGLFRPDLYYRLNVFPIKLPALRERKDDIPLLVRYFIRKFGTKLGKKIDTIPQTIIEALQAYPWPGNIRELENVLERAMILSQGNRLELSDWLPKRATVAESASVQSLEELERAHMLRVLEETGWRVSGPKGAASVLGLKPTTMEARMKKLGIKRKPSYSGLTHPS
jgi:formate hydrogenlyase transcriptional activator